MGRIWLQHAALTSKMSMFGLSFLNRFHFPQTYDIWRSRLTEKHIQLLQWNLPISQRILREYTRFAHVYIYAPGHQRSFFEGLWGFL